MPFPRPTLSQLRSQARQYLQARLPGADLTLRRSALSVFSDIIADLTYGEYGYLDWMSQQLLPDTASDEYLERWASIFGITRQPASLAAGNIIFNGVAGATLPNTTLVTAANGIVYRIQLRAIVIPASGSISVPVMALTAGAVGNQIANAPVNLNVAVPNITGAGAFDANGATGGVDAESDNSLRGRVLLRIQQPPQGGAASDYIQWTLSQSGVSRAWVYPNARGVGTVNVTFVMDGRASIIPLADDVTTVQSYLNKVAPVTADVFVFAPVPFFVNVVFNELNPNTSATQSAITTSLAETIRNLGIPGQPVYYSQLVEAAMTVQGVNFANITSPGADLIIPAGNLPILGTVSYPSVAS